MLSRTTRGHVHTLLDARTLVQAGDQPALIYLATDAAPQAITQRAFVQTARAYAAAIQALGIQPGDVVIVAQAQPLDSVFCFWGALLAGAVPSIFATLTEKLDPEIYRRSVRDLVKISGARAVLASDNWAQVPVEGLACEIHDLSQSEFVRNPASVGALELPQPQPEAIAFLQHSSGTTGLQKGVALSHRAVLNQLANYSDALDLRADDIIVSWLPLYHDMGLIAGFLMPLIQGIPLVLMSPLDWVQHPAMLLRAIHDYRATLCWLPNFAYNHCARRIRKRDSESLNLSSMRAFINCSEPVRHDSHLRFAERFAENGVQMDMLAVSYAMAENTFGVTQTTLGRHPRIDVVGAEALQRDNHALPTSDTPALTFVSCGSPIGGTQLKIVDDQGHDLPERRVGEILIKSDCMLTEYYRRPDLQPFNAEGWYQTGDRGYAVDEDVFVIGRSKDLIINAGKNIYPQDVEAVVSEIEGIIPGRVAAFGVADEVEGTELIAVIAETPIEDADGRLSLVRAIRQAIVEQIAVTVTYVQMVEPRWLIKTSSGKVARRANRDKWLAQRQAGQS